MNDTLRLAYVLLPVIVVVLMVAGIAWGLLVDAGSDSESEEE